MQLVVSFTGQIRCLYDESIPLAALGPLSIRRASYVEPNREGQWMADLAPLAGPILGPFEQRSQALSAEQEWLEGNWLAQLSLPR
jgi:hypothetical protein